VEDEDEKARTVSGGLMAHSRLTGKVNVRSGADDPIADVELALEDDHGVRRRMTVRPAPDARRISDQVVLLTRVGVFEQQADPDAPVLHRGGGVLGGGQVQPDEAIDDHRFVHVCMHELG
jgi:hypothetical protein